MFALLFLIVALICFAVEVITDFGDFDLFALGFVFLTLAMIFGNRIVTRRVPQ